MGQKVRKYLMVHEQTLWNYVEVYDGAGGVLGQVRELAAELLGVRTHAVAMRHHVERISSLTRSKEIEFRCDLVQAELTAVDGEERT